MHFKRFAAAGALLSTASAFPSVQQRTDQSICDKYTIALLKDNTAANQYALLTQLVNTVVIGNYSACAVSGGLAGILAPVQYGGEYVNLLPYFNGCLKSSNVDGMPAYVNFLDDGGAAPLMMNKPSNTVGSMQYYLLTHLYQFFGKLLGCSGYGQMDFPAYGGDPSMGRVHKFMALDAAEVGYFISQVGAAATCFGVSSSDVSAVAGVLMQYFGYRCSPPLSITDGPQLQSICEDCSCPLDPNAQCSAYGNSGGCFPEPMTAASCMSYKPTQSYSSMYEPKYTSKYEHYTSKKYEEPKYTSKKYEEPKYTSKKYEEPKYTTKEYEHYTSKKYEPEYTTTKKEYYTTKEYKPEYTTTKKEEYYTTKKYETTPKEYYTTKEEYTTKKYTTPKEEYTTKKYTTPKEEYTTKKYTTPKEEYTTKKYTTPKEEHTTKYTTTTKDYEPEWTTTESYSKYD